jgi:hypothetical protein
MFFLLKDVDSFIRYTKFGKKFIFLYPWKEQSRPCCHMLLEVKSLLGNAANNQVNNWEPDHCLVNNVVKTFLIDI